MLGVWLNHGRFETWLSGSFLQECGNSSMLVYFGHLPAGWGLVWAAKHLWGVPIKVSLASPWLLLTLSLVSIIPSILLWKPYERISVKFASGLNRTLDYFGSRLETRNALIATAGTTSIPSLVSASEELLKKQPAKESAY